MDFKGYMIEGTWDGSTLTVQGTNKASHVALVGKGEDRSAVVIPRQAIASAKYKSAGMMTNGNLDIRTHDGVRYQLHFLKKHTPAFEQIASDLGLL